MMEQVCDFGDFFDFEFPPDGSHHKVIKVEKCQQLGIPYLGMVGWYVRPMIRCEEHAPREAFLTK